MAKKARIRKYPAQQKKNTLAVHGHPESMGDKATKLLRDMISEVSDENKTLRESIHASLAENEPLEIEFSSSLKIRLELESMTLILNDEIIFEIDTIQKGMTISEIFGTWSLGVAANLIHNELGCNCRSGEGH